MLRARQIYTSTLPAVLLALLLQWFFLGCLAHREASNATSIRHRFFFQYTALVCDTYSKPQRSYQSNIMRPTTEKLPTVFSIDQTILASKGSRFSKMSKAIHPEKRADDLKGEEEEEVEELDFMEQQRQNIRKHQDQYLVACLVADGLQHRLATANLDELHGPPLDLNFDPSLNENYYTWGRLDGHDVVLVSPPDGPRPRKFADTVAAMLAPFPKIRLLLVAQVGSWTSEVAVPSGSDLVAQRQELQRNPGPSKIASITTNPTKSIFASAREEESLSKAEPGLYNKLPKEPRRNPFRRAALELQRSSDFREEPKDKGKNRQTPHMPSDSLPGYPMLSMNPKADGFSDERLFDDEYNIDFIMGNYDPTDMVGAEAPKEDVFVGPHSGMFSVPRHISALHMAKAQAQAQRQQQGHLLQQEHDSIPIGSQTEYVQLSPDSNQPQHALAAKAEDSLEAQRPKGKLALSHGATPSPRAHPKEGTRRDPSEDRKIHVEKRVIFVPGVRSGPVFFAKGDQAVAFYQLELSFPELCYHLPVLAKEFAILYTDIKGTEAHEPVYRTVTSAIYRVNTLAWEIESLKQRVLSGFKRVCAALITVCGTNWFRVYLAMSLVPVAMLIRSMGNSDRSVLSPRALEICLYLAATVVCVVASSMFYWRVSRSPRPTPKSDYAWKLEEIMHLTHQTWMDSTPAESSKAKPIVKSGENPRSAASRLYRVFNSVVAEKSNDADEYHHEISRLNGKLFGENWSTYTVGKDSQFAMFPGARRMMQQLSLACDRARVSNRPEVKYGTKTQINALFVVDWSASEFLAQQYSKPSPDSLFTAITITGSLCSATATTTAEYLKQNWPNTGTRILEVLRKSLDAATTTATTEDLRNVFGTNIDIRTRAEQTIVGISGPKEFICEIVEQLSWIGSALRSSPSENLAECTPSYSHLEHVSPKFASQEDKRVACGFSRANWDVYGRISFTVSEVDREWLKSREGTCWQGLFRNPVSARRYADSIRDNFGLEIPLNMMAGLLRTSRVTEFDGRVFIKGFSSILFPTKLVGDTITWHLLYNSDGSYLSYLDERIQSLQDEKARHIRLTDLFAATKNVVGWCSEAKSYTGSLDAHHPVNRSACDETRPGWIFEKLSISGGQYINLGLSFCLGVKDKPLHLWFRPTYEQQVLRMSKKYVLLYDVGDNRGWLVNGASALLHLVIASWKYELSSPIKSRFLSKVEDLRLVGRQHTAHSAIETLIDRVNMALPILPGKRTFVGESSGASSPIDRTKVEEAVVTFSDRVEEAIDYLEKAFTYQEERMYRPGYEVSVSAWNDTLVGFDFAEISESESSIPYRFADLGPRSKGWMAFVQKIKAVTLFGRDFGDLITPDTPPCRSWANMPTGEDYVAIHVQDMNEITKRDPRALHGFIWYQSGARFNCTCAQGGDVCDRAQALVPMKIWKRHSKKASSEASFNGNENGAIVFGYKR
ncbi:hypothetical protein IWZ01DRAFT_486994 [Phyllosticta capitalensis]